MRQTIIAQNDEPDDEFCLGIVVETIVPATIDVVSALRDAARDFSKTEKGQGTLEETHGAFNWGDLVEYLPEDVCVRHGIRIVDTFQTDLVVPHNEMLIS